MDALDEMKGKWAKQSDAVQPYDSNNLLRVIRRRVQMHMREPMRYFWASFVLQVVVYALYTHAIVRFIHDPVIVRFALLGIIIYIPFTFFLLREFKKLAVMKPNGIDTTSARQHITEKRNQLLYFFRFKLRYEWVLIPLSSLLGTLLIFKIYVPGGPTAYPNGVWITMTLTLLSCYLAIRNENRKRFRAPLAELDNILNEFANDFAEKDID
jgi:hypothetical protein